jgi:hypothetical protein
MNLPKNRGGFDKTNRRGNIANQTSNAEKMQGKEIQVEISKESLTWKERVIEWEDNFILETITNKIVPTTGKRVESKTRVEKLINDEMKLMFSFERKISKEEFGEIPKILKSFRKMFLITY